MFYQPAVPADSLVSKTESTLNLCHPRWAESYEGRSPICVPVCFDVLKTYVASRDPKADGYRRWLVEQKKPTRNTDTNLPINGIIKGKDAENEFYKRIRSLDIGGIVIANFQWQQFRKCLNLEDFIFSSTKDASLTNNAVASMVSVTEANSKNEEATPNPSTIKKKKQRNVKNDFEIDFIILHPQLGIYAVEVKSSEINSHKYRKYEEAVEQLNISSSKISLIYSHLSGKDLDPDKCSGAGIFAPNSELPMAISSNNQSIDIISNNTDAFKKFWNDKIQLSLKHYGARNLFCDSHFRSFVLQLVGYRGDTFIAGPKFSLSLATRLQTQQYFPFLKYKQNKTQSKSVPYRLKMNGLTKQVFFLTAQQHNAVKCNDQLQIIFGEPGTGKTIVLVLKALEAARMKKNGRVIFRTVLDFLPKIEKIFNAHRSEFNREVLFQQWNSSPDDDFFNDEALDDEINWFQERAGTMQKGKGQTVAVFTGNMFPINSAEQQRRFGEAFQHTCTLHTLDILLRNTMNIASFWMKDMGIERPMGHNLEGEPPVHKKFSLAFQVKQTVATTLEDLLNHGIKSRDVAIIGPNFSETEAMLDYLKAQPVLSREKFVTVKDHSEGENGITLDEYIFTPSSEWIFVIMFSLNSTFLFDGFVVAAASRAICSLFFFERDCEIIQTEIDQLFHQSSPSMHKKTLVSQISSACSDIVRKTKIDVNYFDVKMEVNFHHMLTVIRHDYISHINTDYEVVFTGYGSFSRCLHYVQNEEKKFRSFVYACNDSITDLMLKNRFQLKGNHESRKPPLVIFTNNVRFFKHLLNGNVELEKIYVQFCQHFCSTLQNFSDEIMMDAFCEPESFLEKIGNRNEWKLVITAATFLASSQITINFDPG